MTASIHALRCAPSIVMAMAAVCAACAVGTACGGGEGDSGIAAAGEVQVVALDIGAFGSLDALAEAAAREHGAPGENEAVAYRLRGAGHTSTAAGLRAMGFRDVVAE